MLNKTAHWTICHKIRAGKRGICHCGCCFSIIRTDRVHRVSWKLGKSQRPSVVLRQENRPNFRTHIGSWTWPEDFAVQITITSHTSTRLLSFNRNTRVTLKLLTHPPPERKRKIYLSTWDSIISRYSLWGLSSSSGRVHQDRKMEKNSTFEKNLKVVITPSSTSFRDQTSIPCVLSVSVVNRGKKRVERWLI